MILSIIYFSYCAFLFMDLYFGQIHLVIVKEAGQMLSKFKFNELIMIVGLFLIIFVIGADSFIISPLLPAISHDFDISVGQAALSVTVYALCYAVGSPFFGPLGDRYNKKHLLIVGISIFLIGSVLCAIATNIIEFYLFRAIAGLGAALTMPNIWANIGSYFHGKKLNTVMGISMSALSLSIAVGVPLGTTLSQLSNWHMAFWGSSALTILSFAVLIFTIPNIYPEHQAKLKYLGSFKALLKSNLAISALLINLVWMFGFYMIYTFLGTFLFQNFHLNTAQSGKVFIAYGLSNFFASFLGGYFINHFGAVKNVIINGLFSAIFILGLAIFKNNLIILIVFLVLLAIVQGIGVTSLTTYIVNIIPQNRSTVMSFNSSFLYLGLTFGSMFGAITYAKIGFLGIGVCSAIALIVAVCLMIKLKKE